MRRPPATGVRPPRYARNRITRQSWLAMLTEATRTHPRWSLIPSPIALHNRLADGALSPYRRSRTAHQPRAKEPDMSWHASSNPQRLTLCGFAGMPSFVGRPVDVTSSQNPNSGRRRT